MHKRITLAFTLLALLAMTANAYTYINDVEIGKYKYDLSLGSNSSEENLAKVKGFSTSGASSTSINIPGYVIYNNNRYRVNQVAAQAFINNTAITRITLNYGIEDIHSSAFAGCSNVIFVRIPSSVKHISNYVFNGCTNLTNIICSHEKPPTTAASTFEGMPTNTVTLNLVSGKAVAAFNGNSTWKNAFKTIGKNISYYAYDFSANGVNYTIQNGVPYDSSKAKCTIVSISSSVTTLNLSQNVDNSSDNKSPGPYKLAGVADSACRNKTTLTMITSDNTMATRIGVRAFAGCTNLTSANVEVDTIAAYAFYNCGQLASVSLYNSSMQHGLRQLEQYAFGQTALTSVSIPSITTQIVGYAPFYNCQSLTTINVDKNNTAYCSFNGCLYNKSKTLLYQIPGNWNNSGGTSSSFAPELTRVLQDAGSGSNITGLTLLYNLTTIDPLAFQNCTSLTSVHLPSSLTTVASNSFDGCTAINMVSLNLMTAPSTDFFPAIENKSSVALYTPFEAYSSYSSSSIWSKYKRKTGNYDPCECWDFESNGLYYTVISTQPYDHNGITGDGQLKAVQIGNGIHNISSNINYTGKKYVPTQIGRRATNATASLSINQASSITTILAHAFDGKDLTNFTFYNVEEIKDYAFRNCTNMNEEIGTKTPLQYLSDVRPYAFDGSGITAFKGTSTLSYIGNNAFARTTNLKTIDLSECTGLTSIFKRAFAQVPATVQSDPVDVAHEVVKLPNSITRIEEEAFRNNILSTFNFPGNLKTIGAYAFYNTSIGEDIELPYGIITVNEGALASYTAIRIVFPQTITSLHSRFYYDINQTQTLKEIIFNRTNPIAFTNDGENPKNTYQKMEYVPDVIYVPINSVGTWNSDNRWKPSEYYIQEGSYDFTGPTGNKFTVLTFVPDGTGTCQIVYNPNSIDLNSSLTLTSTQDKCQHNYYITEIGDKCFMNSTKLSSIYLSNRIQKIGSFAFYGSSIAQIMNNEVLNGATSVSDGFVRTSVKSIGDYAFNNCKKLHELFLPHIDGKNDITCGKYFFGNNASDFKCWVDYRRLSDFVINNNGMCDARKVYPHLLPDSKWQSFSCIKPISFEDTDIEAYVVTAYDQDEKKATLSSINNLDANSGAVVNCNASNTYYRLNYATSGNSSQWLESVTGDPQTVNSDSQLSYFKLNLFTPRFDKITSSTQFSRGYAYLKLNTEITSGATVITTNLNSSSSEPGDVNGDGVCNAADVTALYNCILNNDYSAIVNGDQNGDDVINAGDVTSVYNIILGN